MTQHDPTVRLRHMYNHAQEAAALLVGRKKEDLARDRVLELSLVRLIEIVGEAANRLPIEDQARYPSIPCLTQRKQRSQGERKSLCEKKIKAREFCQNSGASNA